MAHPNNDITGIWRSVYHYASSSRSGEFKSEHYVRLQKQGNHLVFESLPRDSRSYLHLRLSLDGTIATGSWREETDPTGYYKGAVHHGAIQLVLDNTNKRMKGKWLGHGRDFEINVGPWELTYVGESIPEVAA